MVDELEAARADLDAAIARQKQLAEHLSLARAALEEDTRANNKGIKGRPATPSLRRANKTPTPRSSRRGCRGSRAGCSRANTERRSKSRQVPSRRALGRTRSTTLSQSRCPRAKDVQSYRVPVR
jgi:hypothetical protein